MPTVPLLMAIALLLLILVLELAFLDFTVNELYLNMKHRQALEDKYAAELSRPRP